MSTDPSCKGPTGRWEGTRTLAIAASIALVTAVAGEVGFVAGHFATTNEIQEVKKVQNKLINCVGRYTILPYEVSL